MLLYDNSKLWCQCSLCRGAFLVWEIDFKAGDYLKRKRLLLWFPLFEEETAASTSSSTHSPPLPPPLSVGTPASPLMHIRRIHFNPYLKAQFGIELFIWDWEDPPPPSFGSTIPKLPGISSAALAALYSVCSILVAQLLNTSHGGGPALYWIFGGLWFLESLCPTKTESPYRIVVLKQFQTSLIRHQVHTEYHFWIWKQRAMATPLTMTKTIM